MKKVLAVLVILFMGLSSNIIHTDDIKSQKNTRESMLEDIQILMDSIKSLNEEIVLLNTDIDSLRKENDLLYDDIYELSIEYNKLALSTDSTIMAKNRIINILRFGKYGE